MTAVFAADAADALALTARARPNAVAIVVDARRITYTELDRRVHACATGLAQLGVTAGSSVAVLSPNGAEMVEVLFGAARLGAAVVPVNTRLVVEEIGFILQDSAARVMVYDSSLEDRVPMEYRSTTGLVRIGGGELDALPYERLLGAADMRHRVAAVDAATPLLLGYTSGTTGNPKGARITHRNVMGHARLTSAQFGLSAAEVTLAVLPMFHTAVLNSYVLPTLFLGGTVVIQRRFDPEAVLSAIEGERITYTGMVPTMWQRVLAEPALDSADVSSVRRMLTGGQNIPPDLFAATAARFPVGVTNTYGMTECCASVTCMEPAAAAARPLAAGKPFVDTTVTLIDADGGAVPPGAVGEIVIGGPQVCAGYHGRPEETAVSFRGGKFHSGDLGSFEDGWLYVVGRQKDMIISGGENVYAAEVERVLHSHASVTLAAVVGEPDRVWGEVVKAYVVLQDGEPTAARARDLVAHCARHLAGYKKPRRIEFVDRLPLTALGKVRKHLLQQPGPEQPRGVVHDLSGLSSEQQQGGSP